MQNTFTTPGVVFDWITAGCSLTKLMTKPDHRKWKLGSETSNLSWYEEKTMIFTDVV